MLRHQENLYKTINITYHGKYTPYPMLSYGPYDCPLCPVKGLYHEMVYHRNCLSGGEAVLSGATEVVFFVIKCT